ncbi:penicillin-binding protein 2 [Sphingomonas sp. LB-2]|uniref:penicillin-binding protein 2 n=1 Tax=Sphingomonas caeni TaxID=2984949 RepID=UPI00223248C0|nr:penicillin-binding protein 2 [Sphingomonas caeni]MCW3848837.1 penicillin-binding protein 2 [Sphingomonas caeni]
MRITEAAQAYSFSRRALMLGAIQGGVGLVLAGRMTWLAVLENEKFSLLAESNRINLTLTPPRRGWIVDRNGRELALNRAAFRVDLIPDQIEDQEHVLKTLQQLLGLTPEDVARLQTDLKRSRGFRPIQVSEKLDWERYAALLVRLPELAGVQPSESFARYYPLGAGVGHLLGYVGAASAEQYAKEKDPILVAPGFKLGKDGIEKTMEDVLRGTPGAKRVEVTAHGKPVRELETRPDTPGKNVKLTVEMGLQEYAARRLGTNSGSAVVIDVSNGDILAMVSMPAYDPNSFSDGIGQSEWKMLSEDDHVPLMNKVLQGLYPPGSTVKPMNGLALLAAGIDPHAVVNCSGAMQVGNGVFHCHKRGGHGGVDLRRAVAQSCDIYFYEMVRRVGYDAVAPVARSLGMGQKFTLPFTTQRSGTIPDSAWKLKRYKEAWTVADSLNASIGQGYVLANPLQLAVMAARLASGKALVPRIIADEPVQPAPPLNVTPEHFAIVRDAMFAVVNDGGTGGASRMLVPGVTLAAKTGTAQVRRITKAERASGVLKNAALPFKLRDHALFICFAPADNPKYAAAVVLEHNGHTVRNLDTPLIGRDIMTYLFDKEMALKSLAEVEPSWGGDYKTRMAEQAKAFQATQSAPPPPTPEDTEAAADNVSAAAAAATTNTIDTDAADTGSVEPDE